MNLLAAYLLVSSSFIVVTLFEFAFVLLLSRNLEQDSKQFNGKVHNSKSAQIYYRQFSCPSGLQLESKQLNNLPKRPIKLYTIMPSFKNASLITKIDFIAFCLYVFCYIIFNYWYWITYYFK